MHCGLCSTSWAVLERPFDGFQALSEPMCMVRAHSTSPGRNTPLWKWGPNPTTCPRHYLGATLSTLKPRRGQRHPEKAAPCSLHPKRYLVTCIYMHIMHALAINHPQTSINHPYIYTYSNTYSNTIYVKHSRACFYLLYTNCL